MKNKAPKYDSLQAWMEGTKTNAEQLLARLRKETGETISPQHFSMILRGSRRCSKYKAYLLNLVTGVPVEAMTYWPAEVQKMEKVLAYHQQHERNS